LEPIPGFPTDDENPRQTPIPSSHESEYDPDATPSWTKSRSKGKRPVHRDQSEDEEPVNVLFDLVKQKETMKQQHEEFNTLKELVQRNSWAPNPSTPLHATPTYAPSPVDDPIQKQADRFEKKALSILSARNKVQLRINNFAEWYENLLLDAESIKARSIMDERQEEPPDGLSDLRLRLMARYEVLLRHVISTISASLVKDLQTVV
jgi:hypothetical protein